MIRRLSGRSEQSRGQSVVEFALLAPLMIFILFAILDFARIYTAMMSVESAAREAADYGTTLGAAKWWTDGVDYTVVDNTVGEMRRRACVASSNLPDYEGIDGDSDGIDEDCTNPNFAYCVTPTPSGTCTAVVDPLDGCNDPLRSPPCTVTVTMNHDFHLFTSFQLDFFGVKFGLPVSVPFERDSTFAMTDIEVVPSTTP